MKKLFGKLQSFSTGWAEIWRERQKLLAGTWKIFGLENKEIADDIHVCSSCYLLYKRCMNERNINKFIKNQSRLKFIGNICLVLYLVV